MQYVNLTFIELRLHSLLIQKCSWSNHTIWYSSCREWVETMWLNASEINDT